MLRWIVALCLALAPSLVFAQASGVAPSGGITQLQGDTNTAAGQSGVAATTNTASGAPYRAGNYYIGSNITPAASAGAPGSATKMSCYPATFNKVATVSSLGATLVTVSSGGNVQFALYTDSGGRPNALIAVSSASGSTTTAGPVTTSLTISSGYTSTIAGGTSTSGSVQLGPMTTAGKELWWCSEVDNAVAVFNGVNNTAGTGGSYIGSTTLANVTATTTEVTGVTTASTFGTWPASLSGVTWADQTSRATILIGAMIGSVP